MIMIPYALLTMISLHIRSMWETICDAKAYRKCNGKFCAQNPQFTPKLEFGSRTPPPRKKLKFRQILALWVLTFQIPPPPQLRSWQFGFWLSRTPPPLENWNLGRSWHFGFWLSRSPPPPQKLKFRQFLAILGFDFPEHPPSGGCSMWRLIAVSPKDTIYFNLVSNGDSSNPFLFWNPYLRLIWNLFLIHGHHTTLME